ASGVYKSEGWLRLKRYSGLPMNISAIDLVEIGSGGGSIASVHMGTIVVGPESAGSAPGPICYGRGGTQPTVTDADLVLGYLNPDYFLGGEMPLDADGARCGHEAHAAHPPGLNTAAASSGIPEVAPPHRPQTARPPPPPKPHTPP
ncbi:methylhydantoinase, partial [Candidatus Entotheonella serta]